MLHELDDVGAAKVARRQSGTSYISAYILNSNLRAASAALISAVKEAVDPTTYTGEGYGLAPIGHSVTVYSATEETMNITLDLDLESVEYEDIQSQVEAACENYMAELRSEWEDESSLIVRISGIETKVLAVEGVHDVTAEINGSASNVQLGAYEIPVLGTVTEA